MALKLNKTITTALGGALSEGLNYEVSVVADIGSMQITCPNVTVEVTLPYGVAQDLISPNTGNIQDTVAFNLINGAIFTKVMWSLTQGGLSLDDPIEDWLDTTEVSHALKNSKGAFPPGGNITKDMPKWKLIKGLSVMLAGVWNAMAKTDIEQAFVKTFSNLELFTLLGRVPAGYWSPHEKDMNQIGETLAKAGSPPEKFYGVGLSPKVSKQGFPDEGTSGPIPKIADGASLSDALIKQVMDSKPIKLKDATGLYQPVKATSSDSIYHTVAMFDGLTVAARIGSNGGISIRAEGPALNKMSSDLDHLGVNVKGNYASAHLHAGDKSLQLKTLGAILAAIDAPMLCAPAQFSKIIGKGK